MPIRPASSPAPAPAAAPSAINAKIFNCDLQYGHSVATSVLDGAGKAPLRSLFKDLKVRDRASDGERGDQFRPFQARSEGPRTVARWSARADSSARAWHPASPSRG